ncbi:hypothetical protein [Catellatospora paridis]|nr:hypothetical protein [Catellatospora paridis]
MSERSERIIRLSKHAFDERSEEMARASGASEPSAQQTHAFDERSEEMA